MSPSPAPEDTTASRYGEIWDEWRPDPAKPTAADVAHEDDPGPQPPDWAEHEWCDDGASCEHDLCLSQAAEEAAEDDT